MMSKQIMIAISREYGSGGHRIAEELAKKLNLHNYQILIPDFSVFTFS